MNYINKTECGENTGTGVLGCRADIGYIVRYGLLEYGTTIDVENLTQEALGSLVQSGKLIMLPEHLENVPEESATQYYTSPAGAKIPVRDGLFEWLAKYSEGNCFRNSINTLNRKKWSLILVDYDDEGEVRWWGFVDKDNNFSGYPTTLVYGENPTLNDGSGTPTMANLRIQLNKKGTIKLKSGSDFLTSDSVDLDAIEGVNDVTLLAKNTSVSAFNVSVVLSCGQSYPITGLDNVAQWQFVNTVNNSVVTPASVTVVGDAYEIEGIPAGTYKVSLYDSVKNFKVVTDGSNFYQSSELNITLA